MMLELLEKPYKMLVRDPKLIIGHPQAALNRFKTISINQERDSSIILHMFEQLTH